MQGPLAVSEDSECLHQVAQRPHQDWGSFSKQARKPTSSHQSSQSKTVTALWLQGPLAVSEDSECLDQVAQRPHQDWGKADKLAQIVRRAVKAWLNEDRLTRGLKEVTSNVSSQLHVRCCCY